MPFNERAIECEEDYLAEQLAEGAMSQTEYNEAMQDLQRAMRDEYERDQEDALRAVDDDWGVYR